MSQADTILDAIVTALTSDLSSYALQDFHSSLNALDVEQLPVAMFFNPVESHSRDEEGVITESIDVTGFLIVKADQTGETTQLAALRNDIDLIKTRFDIDPRIASTVDVAWVSEAGVVENLAEGDAEQLLGVIVIATERARS